MFDIPLTMKRKMRILLKSLAYVLVIIILLGNDIERFIYYGQTDKLIIWMPLLILHLCVVVPTLIIDDLTAYLKIDDDGISVCSRISKRHPWIEWEHGVEVNVHSLNPKTNDVVFIEILGRGSSFGGKGNISCRIRLETSHDALNEIQSRVPSIKYR